MSSNLGRRNAQSLDDALWEIFAAVLFVDDQDGSTTSPSLQKWVPATDGTDGYYALADLGGTEGLATVRKNTVGSISLVFQDSYQRLKEFTDTFYGPLALLDQGYPEFVVPGSGSIASGTPDATSWRNDRLYVGDSGTAVAAVQPTVGFAGTIGVANQYAGMTFQDGSGAQYPIISNTTTALSLGGTVMPAIGGAWQILVGLTVVTNLTITGHAANSATPFVPATWTDSGATWLVNAWQGQLLRDSTYVTYLIASNTATVLTLQSISQPPTSPVTGAYAIDASAQPGPNQGGPTLRPVTGTVQTSTYATVTIGSAPGFTVNAFRGMTFVDSAGVSWPIASNTSSVITIASAGTPSSASSGKPWSVVTPSGAVLANSVAYTGTVTIAAYTANNAAVEDAITGGTGTTALVAGSYVTTLSAGTSLAPNGFLAGALVGATITDGTTTTTVLANTAISASGGAISGGTITTVAALASIITATLVCTAPNTYAPTAVVNWFAGQFAGMQLIDGAGAPWRILANNTTYLILAPNGSNVTPVAGSWAINAVVGAASLQIDMLGSDGGSISGVPGVSVLTAAAQAWQGGNGAAQVAVITPTVASATAPSAGTPATATVTAAGWTVNAYAGMWFVDNNENLFKILSNSATVLTLIGVSHDSVGFLTPATGAGAVYRDTGINAASGVTGTLTAGSLAITGSAPGPVDPPAGQQLNLDLLLSDSTTAG